VVADLTIPTDPDALLTDLNDPAKLAALTADPEKFGAFIRNYADLANKRDAGIAEQTKDQVKSILAGWLKDNEAELLGNTVKQALPGAKAGYNPTGYNKRAPGAGLDGVFADKADFLQSVWHRASTFRDAGERAAKLARVSEIQNSFGSTIPADGGFLIPETMRSELMMVALQNAVVRSRATVIPMESLRVPIPMVDSTSNVSSVFGGIVAYWTEEAAALTESQATFGRVVLDAKKLTAYAEPPNELIADASAFGGFIEQMFPKAIAWYEDLAFMKGTGVGEPLGWMNGTSIVTQTAESAQGASTLVWQNIVKMYARMLPSSLNNAVWIASPDTFPELATMALSVGTGGAPVWLNNGVEGPAATILGRPVIFTEMASVLGTAGDLSFVDLSYYLIGDRQAMTAMSSPHYKFANDKTAYRFIERVDGRPWLQSAITPQNGGNTLSPFVQLSSTRT
jgi:HK97 family phage major capsid protein